VVPLEDQETKVAETLTLVCEVNKDNTTPVWSKDGNVIQSSNHVRLSTNGRRHQLTIEECAQDDEAQYSCSVSYTTVRCQAHKNILNGVKSSIDTLNTLVHIGCSLPKF